MQTSPYRIFEEPQNDHQVERFTPKDRLMILWGGSSIPLFIAGLILINGSSLELKLLGASCMLTSVAGAFFSQKSFDKADRIHLAKLSQY